MRHQQVDVGGCLDNRGGRSGVAGEGERAAGAGGAEHLVWRYRLPAREQDGLPTLQQAALLPGRNAEPVGDGDVEAPRTVGLGDQVPDRLRAVVDRERADLVVAAVDRVTGLELERLDRVGEATEDTAQGGEEITQPRPGRGARSGSSRPRSAKLFNIPGSPR